MKRFIFKKLLKLRKEKALVEVLHDLEWFETYRNAELRYNVSKARSEMSKLKSKSTLTEEETSKLDGYYKKIAEVEAIKKEYDDLNRLAGDLNNYIEML